MVGQICREGMDESGILPKVRYAMTVGHCFEQQGVWGCCKTPSGSRAELWWGPGAKQYTVPKKCPPPKKNTFLVHFYLCAAYKLKGKIHLN